jgi:L-alanine-DL-glutamate epimerase-like enolase superfamily enzyme
MGEAAFMKQQIEEKLAEGFTCVKLKIGAIDFDKELDLLRYIRQHFTQNRLKSG